MVRACVAGFCHQAVNALYPTGPGEPDVPPGPRLYSGPNDPRFQRLRAALEGEWVDLLVRRLGMTMDRLSVLWDADFLLGAAAAPAQERYVICEISVSSVAPYPEAANQVIVEAMRSFVGMA
jgi:hypothetical protein